MSTTGLERLATTLHEADSLPFLFVGSGVSRRYLGLESWDGLLRWGASLTAKPFGYYSAQASGYLPGTAGLIAEAFYDVWWSSRRFAAARRQYGDSIVNRSSPLKYEIADRMARAKRPRGGPMAKELQLLKSCQVDGIITTNYESLLEELFPFSVFVGHEDLLHRRSYQLGEIYKIHGSISSPESLVLGAEDYEKFREDTPYLVAKLMSVFVEHPVVFLGYSITDSNIRAILSSLVRCIPPARAAEYRNRLSLWTMLRHPPVPQYLTT